MKNKSAYIYIILIAISLVAVFLGNVAVTFEADDFFYMTNLMTGEPLSSLSDIWESQLWHYTGWGGRVVAHSILQLTLMTGETACNVLNLLVTFLLVFILCRVSGVKGVDMLFLSFSLLLGCMVSFRSSMLWQSGAANYLYMSVIVFTFVGSYLKLLDDVSPLPLSFIWMPVLGLLAGWSNENLGPAVWVLTVAVCVLLHKKGRKVPFCAIGGSITCLAGSAALIAAPGNYVRKALSPEENIGSLWKLFLRMYNECTGLLHALIIVVLVAAFMLVIGRFILKIDIGEKRLLFLLGALLSFGALIMSPAYTDRAYWSPTLFLIMFSLSYIYDIKKQREDLFLPLLIPYLFLWLRGLYLFLGEYASSIGWLL